MARGGMVWHCMAQHCKAQHGTAWNSMALHVMAQHGMARHCMALHGIARHCTALHVIARHCMAQHCMAQNRMAWHSTAWHGIARHGTAWHRTVPHGTAWCCMALHGMARYDHAAMHSTALHGTARPRGAPRGTAQSSAGAVGHSTAPLLQSPQCHGPHRPPSCPAVWVCAALWGYPWVCAAPTLGVGPGGLCCEPCGVSSTGNTALPWVGDMGRMGWRWVTPSANQQLCHHCDLQHHPWPPAQPQQLHHPPMACSVST